MEYRIVKDNKEKKFLVQKKFLFWWLTVDWHLTEFFARRILLDIIDLENKDRYEVIEVKKDGE